VGCLGWVEGVCLFRLGVWGRGILDLGSVVLCFFLMTLNTTDIRSFQFFMWVELLRLSRYFNRLLIRSMMPQ
jgi:hypothetical protein